MRQKETSPGKQKIAIAALLAGKSQDAAGRAAGVSRRSVVRWLADPAFAGELAAARAAAFGETLALLKAGAAEATRALLNLLKSKSPAERRQTAREILTFAFKAVETEDFELRLAGLEKYLDENKVGLGPSGSHRPGRGF